MRDRIVDELRRTDLASNVENAILDAVNYFSRRAHFVNQGTLTPINTVVGQKAYDLPDDFSRMIYLEVVHDGQKDQMRAASITEIDIDDSNDDDPFEGIPEKYAIYGTQMHVYPRPEEASWTFEGRYRTRYAAPDSDDDEGFWVNEAERPIRCMAKAFLYDDVIRDTEQADREYQKAEAAWLELVPEYEARVYEAGVKPWD